MSDKFGFFELSVDILICLNSGNNNRSSKGKIGAN